jgi:hypothetical protein
MGAACYFIGDLARPRKQLSRGTTSPHQRFADIIRA